MKTLLVMAGGTGGHVIPALSVAKELRSRGVRIVWMGTRSGIEASLVPSSGFELRTITVQGLRGTGWLRKLIAPFVLMSAALQAMKIIISSRANALLGMGGFASGPGGLVGWMLGKPLVIHEQNAVAGTTNKLLATKAVKRLSGFSVAKGITDNQHTGNPIGAAFSEMQAPSVRLANRTEALSLNVLVTGGSLGAQVLNNVLPTLFKQASENTALCIRHQSGKQRREPVAQAYQQLELEAEVFEFIDDMAEQYAWADIVICRSGAMTVAEVAGAGAVAIFVPYPHAIDDHQWFNAQELAQDGSAFCFRQADFEQGDWLHLLQEFASDRNKLVAMANKARGHARLDATTVVADICEEVLNA